MVSGMSLGRVWENKIGLPILLRMHNTQMEVKFLERK